MKDKLVKFLNKKRSDYIVCSNVSIHPNEECKRTCIIWHKCEAYKAVMKNK